MMSDIINSEAINFSDLSPVGLEIQPTTPFQIPADINPVDIPVVPESFKEIIQMNQHGIDGILATVKFLGLSGKAIKDSLADDGKITFGDSGNFIKVALSAPKFLSSLSDIPAELSDEITAEEKAQIVELMSSFGVLEGDTAVAAEEGIQIAIDLKNFIFKHFVKA